MCTPGKIAASFDLLLYWLLLPSSHINYLSPLSVSHFLLPADQSVLTGSCLRHKCGYRMTLRTKKKSGSSQEQDGVPLMISHKAEYHNVLHSCIKCYSCCSRKGSITSDGEGQNLSLQLPRMGVGERMYGRDAVMIIRAQEQTIYELLSPTTPVDGQLQGSLTTFPFKASVLPFQIESDCLILQEN